MALTNKQTAFIEAYLVSFNATQAAIEAGYSPKTAYSIGWENLRKPEIAEYIKMRLEGAAMTANEVLARLSDIARGDITEFIDPNSMAIDLVNSDKKHLIKKVSSTVTVFEDEKKQTTRTTEATHIELYSAQDALNTLARHLGLFDDKLTIKGEVTWKDFVETALGNGDSDTSDT